MAGVGGHTQPHPHRARRRRAAAAVAGVHAAGRGDHRPLRPAQDHDRRQRVTSRAHARRRRCRAVAGRWSSRPQRARRRDEHRAVAVHLRADRHPVPRCRRGALRQQRPDDHAGDRRAVRSGEGEREVVGCRGDRQQLRRPATGVGVARRRVRAAVRPRRRHVRDLCGLDLRDQGDPTCHRRSRAPAVAPGCSCS